MPCPRGIKGGLQKNEGGDVVACLCIVFLLCFVVYGAPFVKVFSKSGSV